MNLIGIFMVFPVGFNLRFVATLKKDKARKTKKNKKLTLDTGSANG